MAVEYLPAFIHTSTFFSIWLNPPSTPPTYLFWTSNSHNCVGQEVTVQSLKQVTT